MQYSIKQSFYLDSKYSGEAGTEIDKESYDLFNSRGLQDHVQVTGLLPAFLKSTEDIEKEITALYAELDTRQETKKHSKKVENPENDLEKKTTKETTKEI